MPGVGLGRERRVARPAGREAAEEDRRRQDRAGRHQEPERERLDPREGHPPGADHDRDEVVRERAEDPARHHPHHHRAVHADDRQVRAGGEDLVVRSQQLGADQHRVQAADEEEQPDAPEVLDADDLVVGAEAEVARPASLLLLPQRRRVAEQALDRVVEEAEADEEADDRRRCRRGRRTARCSRCRRSSRCSGRRSRARRTSRRTSRRRRGRAPVMRLKPIRRRQSGGCGAATAASVIRLSSSARGGSCTRTARLPCRAACSRTA